MTELWMQTDEADDVAGSIRHVIYCISNASRDEQLWKWSLLAMHSAIQGACVCHLVTTSSPYGAVNKKNAIEWLTYFENSRTNLNLAAPKTKIMSLPDLLKAIRKPHSAGDRSNYEGIALIDSELELLIHMHEVFRNQFSHYAPMSWSIEVSGLPSLSKLIARIIIEIQQAGWAFRHKDLSWNELLTRDLNHLSKLC